MPENFRTSTICINAIKKDVNILSFISQKKRYELFDDSTEIDLIEKIVAHNPKWLVYMPNRPDVKALCINYMEEDLSLDKVCSIMGVSNSYYCTVYARTGENI